jgi:hypothetical protein
LTNQDDLTAYDIWVCESAKMILKLLYKILFSYILYCKEKFKIGNKYKDYLNLQAVAGVPV